MDTVTNTAGRQAHNCSGYSVRAALPNGACGGPEEPKLATVSLSAEGPEDDGAVVLDANGRVGLSVGDATVDVMPEGVVMDAGNEGNVGLRAGIAPAQQSIDIEGNGGSIVLQNGQLPMTPKIEISTDSIELSVGLNKITIGPSGIEITGMMVSVEGEADVSIKGLDVEVSADVSASVTGNATVELSASGQTTVKGAMVMIN